MRIKLIYAGRFLTYENKILHHYVYFDDLSKEINFSSKITNLDTIGNIIECEKTDTGVKGKYEHLGKFADAEKIAKWIARDRSCFTEFEAIKQAKKQPNKVYENSVDKLKGLMYDLTPRQKKIFLINLMLDLKM